jgi:uncharacterized protein (DUF1015 family)
MATVTPFKGVVYNPDIIFDPADVCTPPYDVISTEEQQHFYDRNENNIIRLELGRALPSDTDSDNPHTRAGKYFKDWLDRKILVIDDTPAIYLTAVEFVAEGQSITRYGMIARVGLEPFEKKIILPHEKTFSKVKSERLNLMKTCHVNFSPIFSIYPDEDNTVLNRLKDQAGQRDPDMVFTDFTGLTHRMWKVTDGGLLEFVTSSMADKTLYIADGHHRYETALNYKSWLSEQQNGIPDDHPARFVMMYLSCMDEPGLVVLPAHRLLAGLDDAALSSFINDAKTYFDITEFSYNDGNKAAVRLKFQDALKAGHQEKTIGVCMKNTPRYYLMKTKPGVMASLFADELPDSLITLDVSVLTHLIFMKLLGFNTQRLDNEKLISYASNTEAALDSVEKGTCDAAFILNHTKIEQVKQVAEEGLIMPRKSTYFYPKVVTGQVMHKLY